MKLHGGDTTGTTWQTKFMVGAKHLHARDLSRHLDFRKLCKLSWTDSRGTLLLAKAWQAE